MNTHKQNWSQDALEFFSRLWLRHVNNLNEQLPRSPCHLLPLKLWKHWSVGNSTNKSTCPHFFFSFFLFSERAFQLLFFMTNLIECFVEWNGFAIALFWMRFCLAWNCCCCVSFKSAARTHICNKCVCHLEEEVQSTQTVPIPMPVHFAGAYDIEKSKWKKHRNKQKNTERQEKMK